MLREESMRSKRELGLMALLVVLFLAVQAPTQEKAVPGQVDLHVVKYDGLADSVRQLQGKVVVVDFWGNDCLPCKKAFPHLVEMHRKYARDGFAAVSVNVLLDPDLKLDQERERALKFLKQKEATFTNLFLDEKFDFISKKLRFDGIPCVYVFNREGKWRQFKDEFDYNDVEKQVVEWLKAR